MGPVDLVLPFIPDPSKRLGPMQTWSGTISAYTLLDSDSCLSGGFPRAQIFFARDDAPGELFAVYIAPETMLDGRALHCAPGPGAEALPLQGSLAMCPALPGRVVFGKTRVKLRVWFQVGRLQAGLQLLPATDRIDILR